MISIISVHDSISVLSGYQQYRVMKCEKLERGKFSYGVFRDDGMLQKVMLDNGISTRDPLNGINNIQLRLSDDNTIIHGVIAEDDCVLLKSAITQPEPVANGNSEENTDDVTASDTADDADALNEVVEGNNDDVIASEEDANTLNEVIINDDDTTETADGDENDTAKTNGDSNTQPDTATDDDASPTLEPEVDKENT